MGTKVKETCTVLSQECIGKDIYSMWIQTKTIAGNAKPGQFVSVYTQDGSKLLPRPISLCEIDKEKGALRLVYRVTGPKTGTESFSRLHAGAQLELLGPLGNGFPLEEAAGRKVFLMGGGIGVRRQRQMCIRDRPMHWRRESPAGFPWKSTWLVESVPALAVYASPQKRMPILMYTISAYVKTARCSEVRRWSYEQNERKSCRSDSEKSSNDCIWNIWFRCGIQ